jgi:hypothetical protein
MFSDFSTFSLRKTLYYQLVESKKTTFWLFTTRINLKLFKKKL